MNENTLLSYIFNLEKQGSRPALYYKTGFRTFKTSYAELFKNIQKKALYFEKQGLKKGDRVILWGANSPEWAEAFLGCLLKGIIAVPLDAHGSAGFVKKIFKFTEAIFIVGDEAKNEGFNQDQFVSFKTLGEKASQFLPEEFQSEEINPKDTAEILFTSGTTAEPKGVVLTHENIFSNVESFHSLPLGLGPDEKWLSLLPLSHIFEQTLNLLFCLRRGYSITYLKILKPSSIFETLEEDGINCVPIVPRLLGLLEGGIRREVKRQRKEKVFNLLLKFTEKIPLEKRRFFFPALKKRLGNLKIFIAGGAALEPELERFWEQIGVPIVQGYGLTETSPVISCNTPEVRRFNSIGKALPCVEVCLSDDKEIRVRGKSVFKGYYQNSEKTNKAFEGEWFKTGDLGRFDSDGFLYYLGRKEDLIVTSGGLNVYPADIEAAIKRQKEVKEAVVLGLKKEMGEIVHAVLILEDGSLEPKKVVERANAALEDYQKIQSFSVWSDDDFPRTLTMKIKKNEVRRNVLEKAASSSEKTVPKEKASKLYGFLARLADMKVNEIKPESRLGDDLGLSSLDRVELATIIEEEFHFDVPDGVFLPETRVEEIESLIQTKKTSTKEKSIPKWATRPWAKKLRVLVQNHFLFPLVHHFCDLKIEGLENLKDLKGPVIFIANHTSHLDAPVVAASLPPEIRGRVATAAWREFFEEKQFKPLSWMWRRFCFYFTSLSLNVYLFPQTKGVKRSMEHTGWLIDHGFNVLFFPEGARTVTGKMGSFKEGVSMMVSEMQVPVVPVAVKGLFELMPRYAGLPKRGKAICRFGKPIVCRRESYDQIRHKLEKTLRDLVDSK